MNIPNLRRKIVECRLACVVCQTDNE